jgi:methyltransferase (TIGR00027 family)
MTAETPSFKAQRIAIGRAVHQRMDDPKVFEDPLAIAIAGGEGSLKDGPQPWETVGARQYRALVSARSRFAEDELSAAISRGASQYIILGAGLDTYAYRHQNGLVRVFEVDHPLVQSWKRARLDSAGIAIPPSLTFLSTDFGEQTLASALHGSGFQPGEVTFFSWLGVAPYSNAEATIATLAFIGSMPSGSGVVFDYAVRRSALDSMDEIAMDALASRIAGPGGDVRLVLDPRALGRMLESAGFHEVEDLGPGEIDARYFSGRGDGLRVSPGLAHLVSARV